MYFSPKDEATKLIDSVAPFVNTISSLYCAFKYFIRMSLVASNLFVALTARVWTLLPTLEYSVS